MPRSGASTSSFSRRSFLFLTAGTAAGLALSASAGAFVPRPRPAALRRLSILSLHTHERLDTVYWRGGRYVKDALYDIDHILRDWRTGSVERIDAETIDFMHAVIARSHGGGTAEIISGYRSPATNAQLAARSSGVARRSYHTYGRAIDFRVSGHDVRSTHRTAVALERGGAGLYTRSAFVHVDNGPVRSWGS